MSDVRAAGDEVARDAADLVPRPDAIFLRACRGEAVERTPVWIMRQAGRYLPEYRALRERHDFLVSCRTPELACEITLQPVRRLGVDAAILFSDILIPLPGMGVDVSFNPGPQLARTIRTARDVATLRVPDPGESMPFVLEAIRLLRRELGSTPLIGFAGAPLTMAAYLVEGGATRSFETFKALLFGAPEVADALLAICAETTAAYLAAQVRAGAQAAMLFDTWAGQLSPDAVAAWVVPHVRRVLAAVASAAAAAGTADLPIIYYAGNAGGWLDSCRALGANVIGLDWRIGLDAARRALGPDPVLQGNLDPAVLLGTRDAIRQHAARVIAEAGGRPGAHGAPRHIFNLGHGILPATPPDHARWLVDAVRGLTEVA